MGLFEQFPYSNFHELNLDWFLTTFRNLLKEWEDQKVEFTDLKEAWRAMREWVENYFENLDVQEEINKKLDAMYEDGTLEALLQHLLTDFEGDYNNRLAVLESRMDTFASLPDGSTAGNAELLDARTSYTGHEYPSAGNAIRAADYANHQSDVWNGAGNLIAGWDVNPSYSFNDGSSATINGSEIVFTGPAAENHTISLFGNTNNMPLYLRAGDIIYYNIRTANEQDIYLRVYSWYNGASTNILFVKNTSGRVQIPGNAQGLSVQVFIASGCGSDVITVDIYKNKTNQELTKGIDSAVENDLKYSRHDVTNLFDSTRVLADSALNDNGSIASNNNFSVSDYIPVYGADLYAISQLNSGTWGCWYDSDKNYMSGVAADLPPLEDGFRHLTIPEGAAYCRFNVRNAYKDITTISCLAPILRGVAYNRKVKIGAQRIAMFGDSFIWGRDGNSTGAVDKTIPEIVEELTGHYCVNYGVGSVGWVSRQYSNQIAYEILSATDITNYDAILFAFGVNDSAAPLGTWNDTDESTVMGQVNKCIKYVGATNPAAQIILLPAWNNRTSGTFPKWRYAVAGGGGWTREEMEPVMKQCADYYHCRFISMKDSPLFAFGLGSIDGTPNGPLIGTDNVHPTQLGYTRIGHWLAGKISEGLF